MRRSLFLTLLALCIVITTSSQAAKRALVVGNDLYPNLPAEQQLKKAVNDARSMAGRLRQLGYVVTAGENADFRRFYALWEEFSVGITPGDEVAIFFSGHGVEIKGQNFLVPVDTVPPTTGEQTAFRKQLIDLGELTEVLKDERQPRVALFIIDACRNNPFGSANGTRAVGGSKGLAMVEPPRGTFMMFSAGSGEFALDRLSDADPDPNSVYTRNLLPLLGQKGLTIQDVAQQVRAAVSALARTARGHDQNPGYRDELLGERGPLCIAGCEGGEARVGTTAQSDPAATAWAAAAQSGNRAMLEAIVQRFPDTVYADFAKAKLVELGQQIALVAPPDAPRKAPVTDCDRLAASPIGHPDGVTGIADQAIDHARAIPACESAVVQHPAESRFPAFLGRALLAAGRDLEAAVWLRKAAEADDAFAMSSLGYMYRVGRGIAKDDVEAVLWFRKSADKGYTDSMVNLGQMYQEGHGIGKDETEAFLWFRKAADAGNAYGFGNLGYLFETGRGVGKDEAHAVRWYQKAAAAGDAYGMARLGQMYERGRGIGKDVTEAARWYGKAAAAGSSDAMADLGQMYENGRGVGKDETEAVRWYRSAASNGSAFGMVRLGAMVADGRGTGKDEVDAMRWYGKAAEAGNADAMTNIGVMYRDGRGVGTDDAEAARWFRKAAEGVSAEGMTNLGYMYETGRGVDKSQVEAVRWYGKAAAAGSAYAMASLGFGYLRGDGIGKDEAAALRWFRSAADAGDVRGIYGLGLMYEEGRGGVGKDGREAAKWILRALKSGHDYTRQEMLTNNSAWSVEFRREVQYLLKTDGAYDGAIDGEFGSGVKAAIDRVFGTAK